VTDNQQHVLMTDTLNGISWRNVWTMYWDARTRCISQ